MRLDDARSVRRLEDVRFLTGRGRYAEDFTLPGQVRGYLVRSPHGHAAIDRIDTAAARGAPGVLGVFTEADLRADGIGPLPCVAQVNTVDPIIVPPRHALARGLARDAAELIAVDYRPLDAVADAAAALSPGAPLVWGEAPGNLCFRFQRGDRAATDAAFSAAAHIVEIELVNNRLVPTPIEPRAAIGSYDPAADCLHLLLTGQGVHGIRRQLAEGVF